MRANVRIRSDHMTPSMHTMYCASAERMTDVDNAEIFADQLAASESLEQSCFRVSTLSLLAWCHDERGSLQSLMFDGRLPYALTRLALSTRGWKLHDVSTDEQVRKNFESGLAVLKQSKQGDNF
jgi:hypothetical protein